MANLPVGNRRIVLTENAPSSVSPAEKSCSGLMIQWFLAFHRSPRRWVRRFNPTMQFSHVVAFGYAAEIRTRIFPGVRLFGVPLLLLPDEQADPALQALVHRATILEAGQKIVAHRWWPRLGLWWLPALSRLVGVRSRARLADALFRDCLAAGAPVVPQGEQ